ARDPPRRAHRGPRLRRRRRPSQRRGRRRRPDRRRGRRPARPPRRGSTQQRHGGPPAMTEFMWGAVAGAAGVCLITAALTFVLVEVDERRTRRAEAEAVVAEAERIAREAAR